MPKPLTRLVALSFLFALLCPQASLAQLATTTITGQVLGLGGVPAPATAVELLDPLGHTLRRVTTRADGRFQISMVAPGTYSLRASSTWPSRRVR